MLNQRRRPNCRICPTITIELECRIRVTADLDVRTLRSPTQRPHIPALGIRHVRDEDTIARRGIVSCSLRFYFRTSFPHGKMRDTRTRWMILGNHYFATF
jgi:hypothetical protein